MAQDILDDGNLLIEGRRIHDDKGGGSVFGKVHGLTRFVAEFAHRTKVALEV